MMQKASIFKNNKTQAIRLPKAVAFPETVKQVEVTVIGNSRLLVPLDAGWDYFFDQVEVPDDFMTDREQPACQEREAFFP